MSPQRGIRIDVASDITIPIKTSLSVIIARDPLGLDVVETKNIDFIIDYIKPESGYSGSYSYVNTPGPRGYTGSGGSLGPAGPLGFTGSQGSTGTRGFTGSSGIQGYTGSQGPQGITGFTGSKGVVGESGVFGYTGSQGNRGITGIQGLSGLTGFTGSQSFTGYSGSQGYQGSQGIRGYNGSNTNTFTMFRVPNQNTIIADKPDDVLDFIPGNSISLSTSGNSITITNTLTVSGANHEILRSSGTGGVASDNKLTYNGANLAVIGNITATGDIISGFSDDRLKNRIHNITQAVEKIQALQGFYYVSNELACDLGFAVSGIQAGLSAQAVEKVLPEVVSRLPIEGDYLSVNYERLIPLLIEAIKAQEAEITELETLITQLEAKRSQN